MPQNLDPDDITEPSLVTGKLAYRLAAFLTNPESKNDDRDAQAQVEKALPIMIVQGFTGAQTSQLVEWMKNGNVPEAFQVPGKSPKAKRVKSEGQEQAKATVPTKELTRVATTSNAPIGATPRNDNKSLPTQAALPAMGRALGQGVHWARKNPLPVLQVLWGWVKKLGRKGGRPDQPESYKKDGGVGIQLGYCPGTGCGHLRGGFPFQDNNLFTTEDTENRNRY